MDSKRKCGCSKNSNANEVNTGAQTYSGVAIDKADDDKTNPQLVKERTATINNNPRNDD